MWRRDVVLAPYTRWKIGGPAPGFAQVPDEDDLRARLLELEGHPVLALGGGANLLVSDEGPAAHIVVLGRDFRGLEVRQRTIAFGAATPIAALVQGARRADREGLWILEAVPGTMGGALRMNAGTAEVGIWERVLWADAVFPDGRTERLAPGDVSPRYRGIDLEPGAIFVRGELRAEPGDPESVDREHAKRREAKLRAQVYDQPTCGSTWKNPPPPAPSAWKLVDEVGMRGARRGDAQVSAKHANFIVNLGAARAADVVELMTETRDRVRDARGIELEPELHFWGFPDDLLRVLGVVA
jgi:UDP-N-acetylmuramate dehydrogenase